MPKHAKATKYERDSAMIDGLRKHRQSVARNIVPGTPSVEQLIARFREHLDALADVAEREAAWRAALARETRLEKGIKQLMVSLKPLIEGTFGLEAATLRDFGFKPYARPKPSIETLKVAVEKRLATRKLRGTMGRRQKKRTRGSRV